MSSTSLTPYVVLSSLHSDARARLPGPLREAVQEEQRDARRDDHAGRGTSFDALLLVPALTGVVGGAAAMVAGAQSLGDHWDVSDVVIGTLALAALTGIPNVLAAIRLALHGRGAACVSESLNSNNANLLIGLCVPALVLGIGDASGIEVFSAWSMVAITALAVTFAFRGGGLSPLEGAAIIALYGAFVVTVIVR